MKCVTRSSLHIPKGTVRDPPKGTHKEFASMKTSTSKGSKGKAIKHSVPGIGRLTSPEHRVSKIPKTSTSTASIGTEGCNALTNSPLHVPIVPVLWSPPPVTHVTNITPPVNDVVGPSLLTGPPNVEGSSPTVSGEGAVEACMGLVNKIPSSHTGTPRPLSWPDSALAVDHLRSVPMTQPPSHATTPLRPNTFVTGQEGPAALTKVMSQSHQPGSAAASPELLFGPSQENGSQLGDTNENFQSSDASQIHGMMLRYSDSDEVADKEMRQLNLQDAAHTYMMEHDAQDSVTLVPFQDPKSPSQLIETEDRYIPDGQNTRLSQVAQKQLCIYLMEVLVSDCRSRICNSSLVQTGSLYTRTPSSYLLFMMQYFLRLPVVLNHNRSI